jgi:hypothetical protein
MKLTYSVLAITAIVFSIMLILPSDLVQTADAAKASGVSIKKYGPETKHKVCGDRLCTPGDIPKYEAKKEITSTDQTSASLQTMKIKMERLFELHRTQLLSSWGSLSDSEKSDLMKMVDNMYQMMQSMTFAEHMKHMSMMNDRHDYKNGKYGCNCGDGQHGCNCGDGQQGCSCGDGQQGCSCGDGQQGCTCGTEGCSCIDGQHGEVCKAGDACNCSEDGVCTCGEGCTCPSCR